MVLALDQVADVGNMGALLRTATFLGCAAVLASAKNCAPLTPAVAKASSGAVDVLAAEGRLLSVRQLPLALISLRGRGWRVLGADGGSAARSLAEIHAEGGEAGSAMSQQPTVLVVGNETNGLRSQACRGSRPGHISVTTSGANHAVLSATFWPIGVPCPSLARRSAALATR